MVKSRTKGCPKLINLKYFSLCRGDGCPAPVRNKSPKTAEKRVLREQFPTTAKKVFIHHSNEFNVDYLCSSGLILISLSVTLGHKIRGVTSVV